MTVPDKSTGALIKPASRGAALAACIFFIIGGGVCNGYLEGRWANSTFSGNAQPKLTDIPGMCGDWKLLVERDLDDTAQKILQCYNSVVREYIQPTTGERVTVFVAHGPRGPMAVHTPEVCYSSNGIEPVNQRIREELVSEDGKNSFWKVRFKDEQLRGPAKLEVWYAWSDGDRWQAAEYPRIWFTDSLYKIQVAGSPAKAGNKVSPVEDFIRNFILNLEDVGIGEKNR